MVDSMELPYHKSYYDKMHLGVKSTWTNNTENNQISPPPNERIDALCGMTSPNYDEDYNIEFISSTPSEKVVETDQQKTLFLVTRYSPWL